MVYLPQILVCCVLLIASTTQAHKQYFSATYLAKYADLASNCKLTSDKSIECKYKSAYQRLLSVKVYPKQKLPTDVVAEVKIGINPKYANKMDTDFYALLSDGKQAIGYSVHDRSNYKKLEPCFHVEGKPGYALKNIVRHNNGPLVDVANPVPQEFDFLFSTKQKWSGCVTATAYEGSYTTSDHYDAKLKPSEGLTLDIYADDDNGEIYNFRYITVDIEKEY
ncbi:uncharacterized protein [Dysidea avara]|uniref:uncharacterized protein n=1 Tax=Dysidea avara TaxID=196820 RepID=UPI00332A1BE1